MYLDPGFGSMIIQALVAGIAVCSVVLYTLRDKIKYLFSKKKHEAKHVENDENSDKEGTEI